MGMVAVMITHRDIKILCAIWLVFGGVIGIIFGLFLATIGGP